ncbi:MAG: CoA pyrophosphatase [Flavobacteriaceae bacterium]
MELKVFLSKLSQFESIVNSKSGLESHLKMTPKQRRYFDVETIVNSKDAGVLALFYPNKENEVCFLLTLRANYKGTHASQISFPGGKKEKNDFSILETALRETFEEVGVDKSKITALKPLTKTYIPPSNFWVYPFIGFANKKPKFISNYEVETLIEVQLNDLLNEANFTSKDIRLSNLKTVKVPCFVFEEHVVWGATAMILSEIKDLLK